MFTDLFGFLMAIWTVVYGASCVVSGNLGNSLTAHKTVTENEVQGFLKLIAPGISSILLFAI